MGNLSTGQTSAYQIDKLFEQLNSPPHHSHHHHHEHHSKHLHNYKKITQEQICYSGFDTPQGNIVWTPVLTVSYSDFKKLIMHNENIMLNANSSPQIQKIIKALNQSTINKKDIADSQTYIKNGTQQVHIYHTHLKKSPSKTFYDFNNSEGSANSVIIYGCLVKNLVFRSQLRQGEKMEWFSSGNGQKQSYLVDAIGFTSVESLNEIKVIPDQEWNTFFVGFKVGKLLQINKQENTKNELIPQQDDVIYILSACSQSTKTLSIQQTINKVMMIQHLQPISSRSASEKLTKFTMPMIKIHHTYHYSTMNNSQVSNKEFNGKNLRLIEQVQVEVRVQELSSDKGIEEVAVSQDQEVTEMNRLEIEISSAFWLVICREGKVPYLVAKINSVEKK